MGLKGLKIFNFGSEMVEFQIWTVLEILEITVHK